MRVSAGAADLRVFAGTANLRVIAGAADLRGIAGTADLRGIGNVNVLRLRHFLNRFLEKKVNTRLNKAGESKLYADLDCAGGEFLVVIRYWRIDCFHGCEVTELSIRADKRVMV